MRLKLEELKQVVNETVSEERNVSVLRNEIERVLGPSVVKNVKLDQLAEETNYRIDVLERTGRANNVNFNPSVLLKFTNSKSVEARKLAARMLPENYAQKFKDDPNVGVRHAYARRTSIQNATKMLRESPDDHELKYIIKQKRIFESGIPQPKVNDEPFDLYGEKLGEKVKQQKGSELSKQWYSTMAHKFIQDYGGNLEGNWEEVLVRRYCASVRATSSVSVDESKLYKEILKQLSDKDDRTLERYSVNESFEVYNHGLAKDVIYNKLLNGEHSSPEYLKIVKNIFSIKEMYAPSSLRKYMLSEGINQQFVIPCKGTIPGDGKITPMIEKVLDQYTKTWNNLQLTRGQPVRINWSPNPADNSGITFRVELKL